jgi:hypothetical protein
MTQNDDLEKYRKIISESNKPVNEDMWEVLADPMVRATAQADIVGLLTVLVLKKTGSLDAAAEVMSKVVDKIEAMGGKVGRVIDTLK